MKITSDSFADGQRIPDRCAFGVPDSSQHMTLGDNRNPQLSWTDVPAAARSLVLLCVDPDVPSVADDVNQEGKSIPASLARVDFFHWVMIDLPATDSSLAEGECSEGVTLKGKKSPAGPPGSRQGLNDYTNFLAGDEAMGGNYLGYDGPCPPWNDEILHHYHFRLLALDLDICPIGEKFNGADVMAAVEGHVLAETEIVGTYSLNPSVS